MNFGFTQHEEAFREEVREFIQKEFPPEKRWHYPAILAPSIYSLEDEAWQFLRTMSRKLGDKGWLSLSWPKEYGGQDSLLLTHFL